MNFPPKSVKKSVKKTFSDIRSNWKPLLLAFGLALVLWFYIAVTVYPSYSVHINNVPVQIDIADTTAAGYGLSVLSPESGSQTVDVVISGDRTSIGGLTRDDIIAYVDFDTNISDTVGTQRRPIRIRTVEGAELNDYELSVTTMDVKMDRYESATFPVSEVVCPNLVAMDETVVLDQDAIVCDPSSVTIYGPSSALAQVHHIRVTLEDATTMYETRTFTDCNHFDLMDAEGNVISKAAFQVQAAGFVVKVPVYYSYTLPVTIQLSGVPAGFDTASLMRRLRLNADRSYPLPGYSDDDDYLTITIETGSADLQKTLKDRDSWVIGTVPISSLTLGGTTIEVPVTLPEGYTDRSNLQSVYVTMDETDLVAATRWINAGDLNIINGNSGYDFEIQRGRFQITLIGTADAVNKITTDDITATVNLYNAVISQEGTFSHAVTFTLPESAVGVWVSGITKVNVTATLIEDVSASAE
ncbi:MAG: YbbR-like domain-containing protein [Oscillospiraceae bacterium]